MISDPADLTVRTSNRAFFRGGFVIADANHPLLIREGWARTVVGSLQLMTHPEARMVSGTAAGIHIAVIGSAYDPERSVYSEVDVLHGLLEDIQSQTAFYAALDRLAGKYAIVVNSPTGTEIYQDAMGARSVFYSVEGRPVAASHAELVREIIDTTFADFFIPFITSKNYVQRDVKYLPGVATAYDGVLQLTPNTKLLMPGQLTERFWPREAMTGRIDNHEAATVLVEHLEGMAAYLKHRNLRPVIGLTAGTDSRGVLAAVKDLNPYIFTYVRSEKATVVVSKDAKVAEELAQQYDLPAHVWPIPNRLTLNSVDNEFGRAFRLATGYHRGLGSPWLPVLATVLEENPDGIFIRGFGGEVMRGFYQTMSKKIVKLHPHQLANAYDVNSGTGITRRLFREMMDRTQFSPERIFDYDPNDIFYWEHRMGTWGSISLTEADLAMPSMVGYNSRNLFATFMRLGEADRLSRIAFEIATAALAPKLAIH